MGAMCPLFRCIMVAKSSNTNTNEANKFVDDKDGNVAVNVTGKTGPSGLNIGGRITQTTLTDASWTALPTTSLTDRNTLAIQTPSDGSIYINFSYDRDLNSVAATGSHTGGAATFTADTNGTSGNSIALVFDGVDDINTVLTNWNSSNPSNTASLTTGTGTDVLSAETVTLSGGLDMISIGWEIKANGEFFFDVSNDIAVYALADTGLTPTVTLMEIA